MHHKLVRKTHPTTKPMCCPPHPNPLPEARESAVFLTKILAQAGIHNPLILPDSRLRGDDGVVMIQGFYEAIMPGRPDYMAMPD